MTLAEEHVAELLKRPADERARAARVLLESLDQDESDTDAEQSQLDEVMRRMNAYEDGSVQLVDARDARLRVQKRLRQIRG